MNTMENYISVYTRADAIADGIFVDVTEQAKKYGFKIPVAVTTNLFTSYIRSDNPDTKQADKETQKNLNHLLHAVREEIENHGNDSMVTTNLCFEGQSQPTTVWAVVEAQSPSDPSLGINILLPDDY